MQRKTFSKAPIYAKNAYNQAAKQEQEGDLEGAQCITDTAGVQRIWNLTE